MGGFNPVGGLLGQRIPGRTPNPQPIVAPRVGAGPGGYGGAAPYSALPTGPASPLARQPGTPGGPLTPPTQMGRQAGTPGGPLQAGGAVQNILRNLYGSQNP